MFVFLKNRGKLRDKSRFYLIFYKKYYIIYMVEEIFKTERCGKPLNASAAKPFFFYYIIFFIKSQVLA